MTVIYNRIQNNFTQVTNNVLLDARLSGKAFKLYSYMVFRIGTSPNWQFNEKEILKHFSEGRDALRNAFKELIDAGWLKRRQMRNKNGTLGQKEYEIFSEPAETDLEPSPENPSTDKPSADKPSTDKPSYNNIYNTNKEKNNKETLSKKKTRITEKEVRQTVDEIIGEGDFDKDFDIKNIKELTNYINDQDKLRNSPRSIIRKWVNNPNNSGTKTPPKPTESIEPVEQESEEIKNLRSKIKFIVGNIKHEDCQYFANCKIEKKGKKFTLLVKNKKALEYEDVLKGLGVVIKVE